MVAFELLGVCIAPRHHRGALGDAQIGLPQLHPVLFGQLDDPSDRRMQQLGVGREGDVLGLDGGIHGYSLEIAGPQRATGVRHPQALGQENFQLAESTGRRPSARTRQHFTGEEFFQHEFPHERSDLSHWRKRPRRTIHRCA